MYTIVYLRFCPLIHQTHTMAYIRTMRPCDNWSDPPHQGKSQHIQWSPSPFVHANFWWLFKLPSISFHAIKYTIVFSLCQRVWILIFKLFNDDLMVWWIFLRKAYNFQLPGPLYTGFHVPNLGHCFLIWTHFSQFWQGFLACFAYSTTTTDLWPIVPQKKSIIIAI